MTPPGNETSLRVLVVFNTVQLYGMERAVLRGFELLAPAVEPCLVLTRTARRNELAIWKEVRRLGFSHHFLSDYQEWPKLARPRGARHLGHLLWAFVRGNLDVLQALHKSRSRAILFPSTSYALMGVLAAVYCRVRGWPVYLSFHNVAQDYSHLLRCMSPLMSAFTHCSEWAKDRTLQANPYLHGRPHSVIHNRCTFGSGQPQQVEVSAAGGRRRLVYVGQLAEHKGPDLMIEAFLSLADAYRDVDLHIVGEGDPDYVDSLRQLIGPRDHRVVFRGFLEDVEPVLAGSFALLFPTPPSRIHESFGNVAVEAMALGVPVVTFASGSVPSIVGDGEAGFVVESEDPAKYAAAIERLLLDSELQRRMGERARKRFETHFADRVILQQWLQALRPS